MTVTTLEILQARLVLYQADVQSCQEELKAAEQMLAGCQKELDKYVLRGDGTNGPLLDTSGMLSFTTKVGYASEDPMRHQAMPGEQLVIPPDMLGDPTRTKPTATEAKYDPVPVRPMSFEEPRLPDTPENPRVDAESGLPIRESYRRQVARGVARPEPLPNGRYLKAEVNKWLASLEIVGDD